MEEQIKNKVRKIQNNFCGEPVEIKLYYAIAEERERNINIVKSHIEPTYPINCKSIINEINECSENKPKAK